MGRWSISKVGNTGVEDDSKWFPWPLHQPLKVSFYQIN
jgi:hypothetical protein